MTSQKEEEQATLGDLAAALEGAPERLAGFVARARPADLAQWLQELPAQESRRVFEALDAARAAEVLRRAADPVRAELLAGLSGRELGRYVEHLPAAEVVDLLALVDEATREEVLRALDRERARGLRELAAHAPDTAGGIMTTEFVALPRGARVGDAIKAIKARPELEQMGVFVVDERHRPVGYVSEGELLKRAIHTPIEEAMEPELVVAHLDDDQEDVAHRLLKSSASAAAVVDRAGALAGVIPAGEAGDVLEEEAEEDIRRLVGTSPVEQTRLPILTRVRHRLPLMGLTVLGGVTTAHILGLALPSTGGTVDVLRYLPIVIGLAGNVGIQSSTILVRAFATGEVRPEREAAVVRAEVQAGGLIGLFCGSATFIFATLLEHDARFGRAVGMAIAIAVTWAAVLGGVVPIACRRLGIDPAIAAGPFLITLSDVSGAAIFVAVSHVMLEIGSRTLY